MEVRAKTGSEAYLELVKLALNEGKPVSPRDQLTFEIPDTTVIVEDLAEAHVLNTARRVNLRILATEYMHLLGGMSSLEQLDLASGGRFSQFADDGRLEGAYGPRIKHQLPRVVDLLRRDPNTRQAILTIWDGQEHTGLSHDVPCTLSLQLRLRDGRLSMRASMRSSDVILGAPYDWWMFSRLTMSVASALEVGLGSFVLTTGSMHLYERDLGTASDIQSIGLLTAPRVPVPPALTYVGDQDSRQTRVRMISAMARGICLGMADGVPEDEYPGTAWYRAHVPQLTDVQMCLGCSYVFKTDEMYPEDPDLCVECG